MKGGRRCKREALKQHRLHEHEQKQQFNDSTKSKSQWDQVHWYQSLHLYFRLRFWLMSRARIREGASTAVSIQSAY